MVSIYDGAVVLSRLAGVGQLRVSADYELLGECIRLAGGHARPLRHRRGGESQATVDGLGVQKRWDMAWTRMCDWILDDKWSGLVYAEAITWLLRTRFFPDKSARSFVESTGWLRTFIRQTIRKDLFELHGDSGTPWAVPGRGRGLNTAIVGDYANSVEPPIRNTRYPPGTQSTDLAERGQKRLLVLADLNLHYGLLSPVAWEGKFFVAQG